MFLKIGVPTKNFAIFTGNTCVRVSFFSKVAGLRLGTLFKKEAPTQVFSCESCEIFKNSSFYGTTLIAASVTAFAPSVRYQETVVSYKSFWWKLVICSRCYML